MRIKRSTFGSSQELCRVMLELVDGLLVFLRSNTLKCRQQLGLKQLLSEVQAVAETCAPLVRAKRLVLVLQELLTELAQAVELLHAVVVKWQVGLPQIIVLFVFEDLADLRAHIFDELTVRGQLRQLRPQTVTVVSRLLGR